MSVFQQKYSDEQREAFVAAALDRQTSYADVARLAERGELPGKDGKPLGPFKVPASTVRSEARKYRERRLGRAPTALAQKPHRDSVEALRVRLVSAVDHKMAGIEKRLRKDETSVSIKELSDSTRLLRELQALPGRDDPRTKKPGSREGGQQTEGPTRTKQGLDILKAHESDRGPTAPEHTHSNGDTENGNAAEQGDEDEDTKDGERPGSLTRRIVTSRLSAA